MGKDMSETYTKSDLLKELAQAAHISKRRTEAVLETLTQIAYREARQGFAVPGICRLDVVHRKARQVRNPQTNQLLLIAEHDALRVRPVKRAKVAIAPTPRALVQVVAEPETAAATPEESPVPPPGITPPTADAAVAAAAPNPAPAPALSAAAPSPAMTPAAAATDALDEGQFISFRCKTCGQEIEAPLEMVGAPNECPTCGENLIVPYTSEAGTIWYQKRTTSPETLPPSPGAVAAMKGRTIRIELPDDL
jgi:nucleoid DNA-binding protein/DNA-directed RNA polymerase subunit RPC12/RpoP